VELFKMDKIGPPCLLTCYHVVKRPSDGSQPIDEFVHQPFPVGFENLVGKYYVGEWSGSIDAALCRLGDRALDSGPPKNEILGGGGKIGWIVDVDTPPGPRNPLRKYGRSTGLTTGNLGSVKNVTKSYAGVSLSNLFTVMPNDSSVFCDNGDSGAAIVDANGALVGFVWAKYENQGLTGAMACRATEVFKRLTELVKAKEYANYPDITYPNKSFELQYLSF
jgi:hypothetical protein